MKTFFTDRKKLLSVSTVMLMLVVLTAVTHYYLQYDQTGYIWALAIGYFCLLIQSVSALLYGVYTKNKGALWVGIEFLILSGLLFVSQVLALIPLTFSVYFSIIGFALPLFFIPVIADEVICKNGLIKKLWYVIPSAVAVVAISVIPLGNIYELSDVFHKINYVVSALYFLFGLVLATVGLAKKKNENFCYGLLVYSLFGAVINILKFFGNTGLANKFMSVENCGISIMLLALFVASVPVAKNKVKHHKR